MELDAKTIRTRVAEQLHARLGERWLKPGSPKLIIAPADNLTDFSIELDCYADCRYGEYDCAIVAVLKWKRFAKLYKELTEWYNVKFQGAVRPGSKEFARINFNKIHRGSDRGFFWVTNEQASMHSSPDVSTISTAKSARASGDGSPGLRRWT